MPALSKIGDLLRSVRQNLHHSKYSNQVRPPDIFDEDLPRESKTDSVQEAAESIGGAVDNTASGLSGVATLAKKGGEGAKLLALPAAKIAGMAGLETYALAAGLAKAAGSAAKYGGHAQMGLWALDAYRALKDPDYRQREADIMTKRMEDGGAGARMEAILAAEERPVSGLYGIATAAMGAKTKLKEAEGDLKVEQLRSKLLERRRKRERSKPIPKNIDVKPKSFEDSVNERVRMA